MAQITQMVVVIPVVQFSGNDYGAEAIQNSLNSRGWASSVIPLVGKQKLQVTLKKWGSPQRKPNGAPNFVAYDDVEGAKAIDAAAKGLGTFFAAGKEWVVQSTQKAAEIAHDLSPGEVARTSAGAITEQAAQYQQALAECKAKGGWFCALSAAGVPKWVPPVAIGLGIVFLLGQVASIKRAFLGGTSGEY